MSNTRGSNAGTNNKRTGNRYNSRNNNGKNSSRRSDNTTQSEIEDQSELMTELLIWIVLIVSVVLLLCVFNLCGPLSNVFGAFLFGLFGSIAYIFPFILFLSICFYHMNSSNRRVVRKVIYSWILYIVIASIVELLAGDKSGSVWNCYTNGYKTHIGGGLIGGCISRGFSAIAGNLATGILLFIAAIMLFVLITGKLIASVALNNGTRKYNEYMENRKEIRRRREEEEEDEDDIDYDNLPVDDSVTTSKRKRRFSYTFPKNEVKEKEQSDNAHMSDVSVSGVSVGEVSVSEVSVSEVPANDTMESENISDEEDIPIYEKEIIDKFGTEHPVNDNSLEKLVARALESDRIQYTEYSPYVEDDKIISDGMVDEGIFNMNTDKVESTYNSYEDASDSPDEDIQADIITNDIHMPPSDSAITDYRVPLPPTDIPDYKMQTLTSDIPDYEEQLLSPDISGGDEPLLQQDTYDYTEQAVHQEEPDETSGPARNESSYRTDTAQGKEQTAVNTSGNNEEVNIQMPPQLIPYTFPSLDLLEKPAPSSSKMSEDALKDTAKKLQECLKSFKVDVTMTDIICGPTVTRYELQPSLGTRVKKITELENDIKLNLAAADIRIEAPIPGKRAVGIEVPNTGSVMIPLREMLETKEFRSHNSNVAFAVGKDIGGHNIVADIAKMPHMLIAGATGSGKSVCINTIVMSILYKADPNDVKLIMIDPKVVELSVYNGIPHLCIPVVTDPKKAAAALNWAVAEMNDRYRKFAELGVRDMKGFNSKVEQMRENPNMYVKMPQIVIIVDELADLMMVASHDVEAAICRLAQMARAAGLHLIIATQRPSVDVITGLIKANVPSRIAFAVSSAIDSRTILDGAGAEKLLGKGDMLFFPQGMPKAVRVQGAFVSDAEVARVTDFVKGQYSAPVYDTSISEKISSTEMNGNSTDASVDSGDDNPNGWDEKFEEAGRFIIEKQKASIGTLQRVFKIGFNRGARIMDQLCEAGVVSEEDGKKPRNILMTMEEFERLVEEGRK